MPLEMTEEEYSARYHEDAGVCLACGNFTDSPVKPDAQHYKCGVCGDLKVFGLEEALLVGALTFRE